MRAYSTVGGPSKIGRIILRDGLEILAEMVGVVLGADRFADRPLLHAAIALYGVPRRGEGATVFDPGVDFDPGAALDELPALDDVQILRVGRAVVVDEAQRMLDEADRVDDERVAVL